MTQEQLTTFPVLTSMGKLIGTCVPTIPILVSDETYMVPFRGYYRVKTYAQHLDIWHTFRIIGHPLGCRAIEADLSLAEAYLPNWKPFSVNEIEQG